MKIKEIIHSLEEIAPPALQESYDNSGLIVGNVEDEVESALVCLDTTEAIIDEAIAQNIGLIIAHHPIVFKGLKKLNGKNYVERVVIKAIQNKIAIYAIHTNLDNVLHQGVNSRIGDRLGLTNRRILRPKTENLVKLITFIPTPNVEEVKTALFRAGAGHIGNYDHCSFGTEGIGTFRAGSGSNPFVGSMGEDHREQETRLEVILPEWKKGAVISALKSSHPYEEVPYDLIPLLNSNQTTGSGMIGTLKENLSKSEFLEHVQKTLKAPVVRFTQGPAQIRKVAICGGSGSFLIQDARMSGADAYITGDVKYHEFFDGEESLMICDIGHYESEQFTINLIGDILSEKIPNFAVIFAKAVTNPIKYFHK